MAREHDPGELYNASLKATAKSGAVVVIGPDGSSLALTVRAAELSATAILEAARTAAIVVAPVSNVVRPAAWRGPGPLRRAKNALRALLRYPSWRRECPLCGLVALAIYPTVQATFVGIGLVVILSTRLSAHAAVLIPLTFVAGLLAAWPAARWVAPLLMHEQEKRPVRRTGEFLTVV